MAYFNHAYKKVFLPSSVETGAGQKGIDLTNQELAVMSTTTNLSVATAGLGATGTPYYLAQGPYVSSDTLGNGLTPHGGYKETIKSKIINPRYISMLGYMFNQSLQQNIVNLVAEYNCFPCGSVGNVRVDLKGSPALRFMAHNMYKVFAADGMCCKTGESYQDPTWVLAGVADDINGDDYWKQFITATLDTSVDGGATWTAVTASSDSFVTGYNGGSALTTITSSNQGRLVLTAAYSDTTFGNCSFDPRDFAGANAIPIEIANVDVLDDTGDVCVTCGTMTETQDALMAIGHGEEVLRKIILSESYRQHHFNNGARDSIRMREIEQGDEIVSKVTRSSTLYNSYYIQHHVPRFNNPTGVFDNDQYLIELIGLSDAAGAVGGGGTTSAALNTLMGQIETWQDGVNGADSVAYQNLQSFSSIS